MTLVILPGSEGLEKAKYTSKKKGKDGKWIYSYGKDSGKKSSKRLEIPKKGKVDNSADAKAYHAESTNQLPGIGTASATGKKLKDATAKLSIARSNGNYERFIANAEKIQTMSASDVAHSWKAFQGISSKMPDVEKQAYLAMFENTIATGQVKAKK